VKLAEALSLRADATRRVEQLRTRIVANARFQEGEEPTEDAAALLAEAGAVLDELEGLIRRINRTNAVTQIGPDVSTATEYPTSGGRAGVTGGCGAWPGLRPGAVPRRCAVPSGTC
jgi:hypothetical protein